MNREIRRLKIESILLKEVSNIIFKFYSSDFGVLAVKLSHNFKDAKIYIYNIHENAINASELKFLINKKLNLNLKYIPRLHFFFQNSL